MDDMMRTDLDKNYFPRFYLKSKPKPNAGIDFYLSN